VLGSGFDGDWWYDRGSSFSWEFSDCKTVKNNENKGGSLNPLNGEIADGRYR